MIFAFNDNELRHVLIDGEPWFVAIDILRCLGLDTTRRSSNAIRPLREDEKVAIKRGEYPELDAGYKAPTLSVVSESGLYKLIMRSDKPVAREFQDWVTREVLPAIRKTGGYLLNEDMRSTTVADSREEFPLPVSFSDALRKLADDERPLICQGEVFGWGTLSQHPRMKWGCSATVHCSFVEPNAEKWCKAVFWCRTDALSMVGEAGERN
jgi:prophage antirepressor-like protein